MYIQCISTFILYKVPQQSLKVLTKLTQKNKLIWPSSHTQYPFASFHWVFWQQYCIHHGQMTIGIPQHKEYNLNTENNVFSRLLKLST